MNTLTCMSVSAHLRQISQLSKLPVRSVQLGVERLLVDRVLTREIVRNRTYFSLNQKHEAYPLFLQIFKSIHDWETQKRSNQDDQKAKNAIRFASEANEMYKNIKSEHDPS